MSNLMRIGAVALAAVTMGLSGKASARRLYPLTECGTNASHFCRLHGAFEAPPFHYALAIHPACLQHIPVNTPRGVRYRLALVCGGPERPMVWW
jgi:hypothetical protein